MQSQTTPIESDNERHHLEVLVVTNRIKEVIVENNRKFAKEYIMINSWIDCQSDQIVNPKGEVKDLKELVHLQRAIINGCHD